MRVIERSRSRYHRWASTPVLALVVTGALVLAGCQSDAPSGPPAPTTFTKAPDASHAVTLATNQTFHVMPTLPIWQAMHRQASAADVHSPFDLTNLGGPVVTHATNWNVFVNCATTPADCWGTGNLSPTTFLRDLNNSQFIGIVDQYIGGQAAGQFPTRELSTSFTFSGAPTATAPGGTASINDILELVFSAAISTGRSGYRNMFHVFLPQGTDMCISANDCYSPDNPNTARFCAFHASVDVPISATTTLHLLFSVDPYEAVPGCQLPAETRVIDATASSLSHETMETITDPDGDAWFNQQTLEEIGDLCFVFPDRDVIGFRPYVIQEEYSDAVHACTNAEDD